MSKFGKVFIVGAGPGDPGLITVKGLECLKMADVVIYDNLASPELLIHAKEDAELIFAGKEAGTHYKTQDEINSLLVDCAKAGKVVTRLKGGDPFIFGRGGEEASVLNSNGISFEIIPGITSAIAVPAYAGIPATYRNMATSLHIISGHDSADGGVDSQNWSALAKTTGTIVFLMGVANAGHITSNLIAHGMNPRTPCAMIHRGTTADQKVLESTLEKLADDIRDTNFKSPAIGIIGEVVNLRPTIQWLEKQPLFGKRIAVTRPRNQNEALASLLRRHGAEAIATPTMKIIPTEPDDQFRITLDNLQAGIFDAIIFTSTNTVNLFFEGMLNVGKDGRILRDVKIVAIGRRTEKALKEHGFITDIVALESNQEGIIKTLTTVQLSHVLIPRAADARTTLEKNLFNRETQVTVLPVYKSVPDTNGIDRLVELLKQKRIHMVTFTSGNTFEFLKSRFSDNELSEIFADVEIAVLGPITGKVVKDSGLKVSIESKLATVENFVETIIEVSSKSQSCSILQ